MYTLFTRSIQTNNMKGKKMNKMSDLKNGYLEEVRNELSDFDGDLQLSNEFNNQVGKDCSDFYARFKDKIEPNEYRIAGRYLFHTRNNNGVGWGGDFDEPLASQLEEYSKTINEQKVFINNDTIFLK